jgi:hypothetical protein
MRPYYNAITYTTERNIMQRHVGNQTWLLVCTLSSLFIVWILPHFKLRVTSYYSLRKHIMLSDQEHGVRMEKYEITCKYSYSLSKTFLKLCCTLSGQNYGRKKPCVFNQISSIVIFPRSLYLLW